MNLERLWNMLLIFWRNRKIVIPIFLGITIVSLVYAFIVPNKYTAQASILPSGPGTGPLGFVAGWMPGVIEQLTSGSSMSSFLFPEIFKSRNVVLAVVYEPFDSILKENTGLNNLTEYHKWKNDDKAYKGFLDKSDLSYSIEMGTIKISYTTKIPYLSYFVVKTWVDKLEWYLQHNMQTQAQKEYEFLVAREKESTKHLNEAENELKEFIHTHRNFSTDPITNMQYEKLRIMFTARQDLYNFTVQQLESAKIDMIKSIPVVNILDNPDIPRTKSKPRRSLILVGGIILGWLIAILYIVFANEVRRLHGQNKI